MDISDIKGGYGVMRPLFEGFIGNVHMNHENMYFSQRLISANLHVFTSSNINTKPVYVKIRFNSTEITLNIFSRVHRLVIC